MLALLVWLCMLGHETHDCNIMLCMAPRSLLNKYFDVVELCCDAMLNLHISCILCVCFQMHWYVWGSTPSYLPLLAFLKGKCLLVLPPSLGSSLLLRNTWIDRHVSFFAPVSVPMGKCHAVFTGVLCSLLRLGYTRWWPTRALLGYVCLSLCVCATLVYDNSCRLGFSAIWMLAT